MCFASISVTMASSRANDLMFSSTKKVCATGAGSAKPGAVGSEHARTEAPSGHYQVVQFNPEHYPLGTTASTYRRGVYS